MKRLKLKYINLTNLLICAVELPSPPCLKWESGRELGHRGRAELLSKIPPYSSPSFPIY
ncbi:hypothetical protein Scep_013916 [Stephania cephalantha]|uniref:Uncharacterized protein n=1 Tax=Stephania cephalantha TaxID=152367 RepID=A0AAP0J1K9_9MAGN